MTSDEIIERLEYHLRQDKYLRSTDRVSGRSPEAIEVASNAYLRETIEYLIKVLKEERV